MATQTRSFGVSGVTQEELKALNRLIKKLGTDRSKTIRAIIRYADRQEAMKELGTEKVDVFIQKASPNGQ